MDKYNELPPETQIHDWQSIRERWPTKEGVWFFVKDGIGGQLYKSVLDQNPETHTEEVAIVRIKSFFGQPSLPAEEPDYDEWEQELTFNS